MFRPSRFNGLFQLLKHRAFHFDSRWLRLSTVGQSCPSSAYVFQTLFGFWFIGACNRGMVRARVAPLRTMADHILVLHKLGDWVVDLGILELEVPTILGDHFFSAFKCLFLRLEVVSHRQARALEDLMPGIVYAPGQGCYIYIMWRSVILYIYI